MVLVKKKLLLNGSFLLWLNSKVSNLFIYLFFYKGQMANILDFAVYMISAVTKFFNSDIPIQKQPTDNM